MYILGTLEVIIQPNISGLNKNLAQLNIAKIEFVLQNRSPIAGLKLGFFFGYLSFSLSESDEAFNRSSNGEGTGRRTREALHKGNNPWIQKVYREMCIHIHTCVCVCNFPDFRLTPCLVDITKTNFSVRIELMIGRSRTSIQTRR